MVVVLPEVSRTLNEYLLVPNLTTEDCGPDRVDLSAPMVRDPVGGSSPLRIAVPLVSAIMQAVSSPRLAIALAQTGGLSFVHQNQPVAEQAETVRAVKRHKAGSGTPTSTSGRPRRSVRSAACCRPPSGISPS